ncbi:MAG: hypothetical protein ABI583_08455, partial [Betaproteobacteria bacterium]
MSEPTGIAHSPTLSVSIVVYFPDAAWLKTTLETLVAALAHARHADTMRRANIFLVDNQADTKLSVFSALLAGACSEFSWIEAACIAGHGNIGYGRANNLAIARSSESDFHLVLNPDVKLAEDA